MRSTVNRATTLNSQDQDQDPVQFKAEDPLKRLLDYLAWRFFIASQLRANYIC